MTALTGNGDGAKMAKEKVNTSGSGQKSKSRTRQDGGYSAKELAAILHDHLNLMGSEFTVSYGGLPDGEIVVFIKLPLHDLTIDDNGMICLDGEAVE